LYPIQFFTGRNGAGKSLCAVYDTLPTLDAGRPVLSTVRLLDFRNYRPCEDAPCDDAVGHREGHMQRHPLYVPFTRWEQLLGWSFGDVLMDEITGVADSNENAALPHVVGDFLSQMRRTDVCVRVTGLAWMNAHVRLRRAVLAVTRCQSSLPVPARQLTDEQRVWRPRRLAKWVTYDAKSLPTDDHSEAMYGKATVIVKGRHWIPTSLALKAYDTYDSVLTVGTVTDAGRCAHCGGSRRAPECSCSDYLADRAERDRVRAERRLRREHGHGAGAHRQDHESRETANA